MISVYLLFSQKLSQEINNKKKWNFSCLLARVFFATEPWKLEAYHGYMYFTSMKLWQSFQFDHNDIILLIVFNVSLVSKLRRSRLVPFYTIEISLLHFLQTFAWKADLIVWYTDLPLHVFWYWHINEKSCQCWRN